MNVEILYCDGQQPDTEPQNAHLVPVEMIELDCRDIIRAGRVIGRETFYECPECGHYHKKKEKFE